MYKGFIKHTCTAFVLLIKPSVWWCSSWFAPDSVHTTPEEFKNAYSFSSTVRPTVQSNPSRNGAFRKRSSNRRNLKTPALSFRVDGKLFKTDLFEHDRIRRTT